MNWLKSKIAAAYNWVCGLFSKKPKNDSSEKKPFNWDFLIPVTVVALNIAMFTIGHILGMAAIGAVAVVVSFIFVLLGTPADLRKKVLKFLAKYGYVVDAFFTCVLTVMGLHISVTVGITALLIGLNISAFMWAVRWNQARQSRKLNVA